MDATNCANDLLVFLDWLASEMKEAPKKKKLFLEVIKTKKTRLEMVEYYLSEIKK